MIATITLNPCLDHHITVDGLLMDGTNRWSKIYHYAGGKGIDVSRAIYEMGGKTIAYGFIGGSVGRSVEILLDKDGVPYSFTPVEQETRTNFIITDTRNFQQTRIDAPGPSISKGELDRFCRKIKSIEPKPDIMVISGSVPPGVPSNIYYDLVTEAKNNGIGAIVDSEGKWLEEGVRAKPYLIKPNIREAEGVLRTELTDEEAVIKGALNLVEMGVKIAVISRGKDGFIAATEDRIFKAVSPAVRVRSAVGAGDCTMAGFVLKLANGESLLEACRLAAAMGTAAVLTPGTELCRRADVERLLPQIKVWEMTPKEWAKTPFPLLTT